MLGNLCIACSTTNALLCVITSYPSPNHPISRADYAVFELRISESPASRMAIVEHLNIFPHAVPSSICSKPLS